MAQFVLHRNAECVKLTTPYITPGRIFRFDAFELRTRTGELLKYGTRIRLQIKPFRVLEALVERPGELVTREDLRKRLWPDGTFVDFESGLNTAINRLRSALGDSGTAPRYVETLPRLGYRFICDVIESGNGAATTARVVGRVFNSPSEQQQIDNRRLEP